MNKTKIEWCDYTWNPVTGCYHKCPYCYARKQANRFQSKGKLDNYGECLESTDGEYRFMRELKKAARDESGRINAYPFGFTPTLHKYRLYQPTKIEKPQNIFVCSMANLFGNWVPDEWIEEVFEACKEAPQHRYLFLTKNPLRYSTLVNKKILPKGNNYWFGTTITSNLPKPIFAGSEQCNTFVSIEPIETNFNYAPPAHWVIIGAETGNRKDKVIPKKEWIKNIVDYCRKAKIPVFMKDSFWEIWEEPLIRQYPWEIKL